MTEIETLLTTSNLPYSIRFYGVSEAKFDKIVNEDIKAELIDGVMIVHSPASFQHDNVVTFFGFLASGYADDKKAGIVVAASNALFRIEGKKRRFAPDAFFLRAERLVKHMPKVIDGPPDLVVEMISPSTKKYDLKEKRPLYQKAGIDEIWFIDFEAERAIIDRKQNSGYVEEIVTSGRIVSSVLAGFWLQSEWLWELPLPNRNSCLRAIHGDA